MQQVLCPCRCPGFPRDSGGPGRGPTPLLHPTHRGPCLQPTCLGHVLEGKAKLPRGFRFTRVFSSSEKHSRLRKAGGCLPGEKHSTQPPASPCWGPSGLAGGSLAIPLQRWGPGLPGGLPASPQPGRVTREPSGTYLPRRGGGGRGGSPGLPTPTVQTHPHLPGSRGLLSRKSPLTFLFDLKVMGRTHARWAAPGVQPRQEQ